MGFFILCGFLCAYGLLCALAAGYGFIHYRRKVLFAGPPGSEAALRWLKRTGLLPCKIYLLEDDEVWAQVRNHSKELFYRELDTRIQTGAEEIGGTGDSTGHHQRGGLSEL